MGGIVMRESGPVCASCAQPVDARGFVCLNCGAPLHDPVRTIPPPAGLPVPPPPPFSTPPPPPPPPPAAEPLAAPSWDRSPPGSTDSFTFHLPPQSAPLPPAPEVIAAAADADADADDRTLLVNRKPTAEWGLRLASGELVLVDGPLLLGRNPAPMAGPVGARRVRIDDPGRTVSRSHLVVLPQPGQGIVLRDVSSANGVILVAPDGSESDIASGAEALIDRPCSIILGTYEIGIEPL